MIRRLPIALVTWLCIAGAAVGQTTTSVTKATEEVVVRDIAQAARAARVTFSDELAKDFVKASTQQATAADGVYQRVPENTRVSRLASYLSAKDSAAKANRADHLDADDFHWSYVLQDLNYSAIKVYGEKTTELAAVQLKGKQLNFFSATPIGASKFVVLAFEPRDQGVGTAVFYTDKVQTLWTGYAGADEIKLSKAATTRGCEVFVSSVPSKAEVLFNGARWYQSTNTSVVRDPGDLEVVVRLKGFKDWRSRKVLDAGASWRINAQLVPE